MKVATLLVTNPDGSIDSPHKWLCTSPIHYKNILTNVTFGNMSSDPGWRFMDGLHLNQVSKFLA